MNKVLVIGLDGATFDLINPWVKEGKLPNIAQFMLNGSYGPLKSTFPPMTFPAWNSFMTGKNPGKHGVFDFTQKIPNTYNIRFINASSRKAQSIWMLLSESGKRVCSLSVPVTFPPEKVNGVMISGFDAPGVGGARADASSMHPPELHAELLDKVGEYIIASDIINEISNNMPDNALDIILETLDRKAATAKYLLQRENWDLFMILFGESDIIGHHFWRLHDENSPYHEQSSKKCKNAILTVYQRLDAVIGELVGLASNDTTTILMSDHGFGGTSDKAIFLNRWLEREGLLRFKEKSNISFIKTSFTKVLNSIKNIGLKSLPANIKRDIFRKRTALVNKMESFLRFSQIDWKKTKAYSEETPYYPNIWFNLRGREPMGIVEPDREYEEIRQYVIDRLLHWSDDESGEKVVKNVYRREDIYKGDHVNKSPDLIIDWNLTKGYAYLSRKSTKHEIQPLRRVHSDEMRTGRFQHKSGSHRDFGIFLIKGENIKTGNAISGAEIIDLAPTILYLLDAEIPDDMDGKVLTSVFNKDYLNSHAISYATRDSSKKDDDQLKSYSPDEEKEIRERLRGMGYME